MVGPPLALAMEGALSERGAHGASRSQQAPSRSAPGAPDVVLAGPRPLEAALSEPPALDLAGAFALAAPSELRALAGRRYGHAMPRPATPRHPCHMLQGPPLPRPTLGCGPYAMSTPIKSGLARAAAGRPCASLQALESDSRQRRPVSRSNPTLKSRWCGPPTTASHQHLHLPYPAATEILSSLSGARLAQRRLD